MSNKAGIATKSDPAEEGIPFTSPEFCVRIAGEFFTEGLMRYVIIVWAIFLTVGLAVTAQPPQAPAQAQPGGSAIFDRSCASCHRAGEKEVPAIELASRPHARGDR